MKKPTVTPTQAQYEPVSEYELDVGIAHAKKEYRQDIDKDLLRLCVNTTLERRLKQSKRVILPFLAATVIREVVAARRPMHVEKIDACKGAVMKIMSARSATKRARDAQKRKQGIEVPPAPKPVEHPEDKIREVKGGVQLLLI